MKNKGKKGTLTEGLNERSQFDSNSTKPAETKHQRPKKAPIPTGGQQDF
ncbi:MAG: hypothetical protein LPD71_00115 [Shewanella sp.]|nr:hypothetical protein [Shewanella sp.]MCF1437206.1 hypothetical protein [Shewanella sp.]MCF1459480.1 hypothetical protein [Shewanella sp.]